ncbi:glycosyl transferase [Methanocalculus chunghsingensis]|uniref:Glycosyl transferase n=1 Tax=Methanocalculus chunghsingensis TaxID=156457 RepID=A0A8J8B4Y3_9EURY|nr:glycosyltransferase [Methanocalculus chunghsingensis]MBR1368548.1 glycosyl transferase [Methanocalculus chunghsingensis]
MPQVEERNCSLIIPAYNEEGRIQAFLRDLLTFEGEVIIVADGTDSTADLVSAFIRSHPDRSIHCLSFEARLGKGGGTIAGMRAATRPCIGFCDADGSTSVGEMKRLFSRLDAADGVIGSRWVAGSVIPVRQGLLRRFQSRLFNMIIRLLFGLTYSDTQCGAKVFRGEVLDEILDDVSSTGFEFDVELLWRAKMAGYAIIEEPIEWSDRGGSSVGLKDALLMLVGLLRIRFL